MPGDHIDRSDGDRRPGLRDRWRRVVDDNTTATERSLMATWLAFGVTFGAARLVTHGIRGKWLPWGNISAGGTHLHHYNLGIATLAGVGLVAVRGDQAYVGHPGVGAAYGAGSALIADEFALLLDLKDVYWAKQGRISVDVSLGILSVLGLYLTAAPFWHELTRTTRDHVRDQVRERFTS
ncbi:hypothetical protein [Streptomyces nodosus]|uniref:Integral membrane protein n=1 Tax=Streptomyces nodosus TaxID=40318 RepID=A0A0B5DFI0_9ACTN|nr:hypothetical protein [Streptomyces nodosus]AJE39176.1 integral membrane protein [Streptomyces nodosus]MBB4790063.1 hypothetical protein [Streptomyces nodosus]QEV37775.1 hypothetical protein CP978_03760 [Streptomyces nodosus]